MDPLSSVCRIFVVVSEFSLWKDNEAETTTHITQAATTKTTMKEARKKSYQEKNAL